MYAVGLKRKKLQIGKLYIHNLSNNAFIVGIIQQQIGNFEFMNLREGLSSSHILIGIVT